MISDDEKAQIFSALSRIEEDVLEIRDEQRTQNAGIADLNEALYGNDVKKEVGIKTKVNEVYQILLDVRALKKFLYGGLILITGTAGAALWQFISGLFGGMP